MNDSGETIPPTYEVRRATLEDLPFLKEFWSLRGLPADELDKRFTEFQIVIDNSDNSIAATFALKIQKLHGMLHSEAFADLDLADEIRPLIWQRIMVLAKNHGIARLWTNITVQFYRSQGMMDADEQTRAMLPEGFGNPHGDWLTMKLKDEAAAALALEKEFEIFGMAQRQETARVMQQAQVFKIFAYALLLLSLLGLGALALFAFKRGSRRNR